MSNGRNKYQSRESRLVVRAVLLRDWDPIGISDVPEAADEYDAYVGKVYVMLMDQRAAESEIAAYLLDAATQSIGMPHTARLAQRCSNAAESLIKLRPQFETH